MKKTYVKPEFNETIFTVNQSVSACEPSKEVQPVKVDCAILSGSTDNVFYDNCGNNATNTGRLAYAQDYRDLDKDGDNTDSIQYFIWYDGKHSGKPDQIGERLIKDLNIPGSGYHAGYANPEILSIVNHS